MRRRNPNGLGSSIQGAEDVGIWRDLHQRLNQLILAQDRTSQAALQVSKHPSHDIPSTSLDSLSRHVVEEVAILDICLERLGILIALREAPPDPPLHGRATKKRRLDPAGSVGSCDPAGSPFASTSTSTTQTSQPLNEHGNTDSPASRISSPLPLSSLASFLPHSQIASRSSTPISDAGTAKKLDPNATSSNPHSHRQHPRPIFRADRRIAYRDQLPLLPGRLVAFKRPKKTSDSNTEDQWIMAKVVKCISGDRNRYEVEDVDEEGRVGSKQFSWNTTLKSIIPLPVKDQPDSYPSQTLQPGTAVLGLYPETTSFYRGRIKSGPTDRGKKYKVLFEDDAATGPVNVTMEHLVPII